MIEPPEMNDTNGYFKVYSISSISSAGIPTAITTTGTIADSNLVPTAYWYMEYFILIPTSKCIFYKNQFKINLNLYIEGRKKISSDFLLNQAYQLSRYTLANHLSGYHNEEGKQATFSVTYDLIEVSFDDIIGLWIRNQCKQNITEIHDKTACLSLKQFLHIIISNLPSIKEVQTQKEDN